MIIGATLSHRHCRYIGLDPIESMHQLAALGMRQVRLCSYWDECEPENGVLDTSALVPLLRLCRRYRIEAVMCIGVKSPRWPEYYFPHWVKREESGLHEQLLDYMGRMVRRLRQYSAIAHWQVENEPLDPSGPDKQVIELDLLEKAVGLVRSMDKRPVVLTCWGNQLTRRGFLSDLSGLSDVVGVDIYYKTPGFHCGYRGPGDSDERIRDVIAGVHKPVWISELQAEPWERNEVFSKKDSVGSMSPELLKDNVRRALALGAERIYLWGLEYWLWRKEKGDWRYFNMVRQLIQNHYIS